MKAITEKELAVHLMEMRRKKGHAKQWEHYRRQPRRVGVWIAILLLAWAVGEHLQLWWICGGVVGLTLGFLGRDSAYAQQTTACWDVYERFIDWDKVEKSAGNEA